MNHVNPKKHFSQNFLVDQNAKERVSSAMKEIADLNDIELIEIGPGQGDMTLEAIKWKKKFTALEIDQEAIDYLATIITHDQCQIIKCDAMKLIENPLKAIELQDGTEYFLPKDFALISSLPYHIGSRILVDLAIHYPHINFGVIHQKEVVLKTQSNGNFSFFGAWLNLFWNCNYKFDISPHCFSPQPKVFSSFMQGITKNSQNIEWLSTVDKRNKAKSILKKLFTYPSKTLGNNLKLLDWDKPKIDIFLEQFEGNQKTRLSWVNYAEVLKRIVTNITHNDL
jgi:16S rRNA (adenine1518-N6/adenine1519-N6)-dimethyltransferase